jgi:hypothetical protein
MNQDARGVYMNTETPHLQPSVHMYMNTDLGHRAQVARQIYTIYSLPFEIDILEGLLTERLVVVSLNFRFLTDQVAVVYLFYLTRTYVWQVGDPPTIRQAQVSLP